MKQAPQESQKSAIFEEGQKNRHFWSPEKGPKKGLFWGSKKGLFYAFFNKLQETNKFIDKFIQANK